MKKKLIAAAVVAFPLWTIPIAVLALAFPLVARAQGPGPGAPQGGQGQNQGQAGPRRDPERMEKRMRLARTLGLAEALDLDTEQALKLGQTISRFDERRVAAHKQLRDARDVLRRAAQGEKVAPADVDQAIQRSLDARAQLQAVDRDTVAAVTKDLAPEKKARAVLFLSKFQRRFGPPGGPGMGGGMGPGHHGPGMRGGRGGPGGGPEGFGMGPGMGPGQMGPMMGMGPTAPDDDDWDDAE
jgi:hypothetical protein